ncbi:ferritin-like domain-containing protein [Pareuzebyella sediminis]|uniref:ferritin-like domain-containing protein n=1 Tax=Pareuzebyella sediminis TaxID=2607998 RepID=UPI0011EF9AAA|nr:PA2169 family four-helix-bundle protein [Pareuzebyella sediminis]
METKSKKLVDQLEEILEKNRDAQKGYAKAAENAESHSLQSYFNRKSSERKSFNDALRAELVATYDEIDDDGSFTGTIHRTWMDIKNFFSGNSDEAMLEEAIRGDKASVEEYEEVLKDTALPMRVSTLIRDQNMKIRTDLNKIRSLEDLED